MSLKLKDLKEWIETVLETNPQLINAPLFYSVDEEGNEFKPVVIKPSVITYTDDSDEMEPTILADDVDLSEIENLGIIIN